MPQKLATTSNELEELVIVSIKSEKPGSGEILRVHIESMCWHADDENSPRNGVDALKCRMDGPRGWTDTLSVAYSAETAGISHNDGAETHLGAGDIKRAVDETDGAGSHADASNAQTDIPSTENEAESIRMHPNNSKSQNSPIGAERQRPNHPNACRNLTGRSSICTDSQSIQTDALMPVNEAANVRTPQIESISPNLPAGSATSCSDTMDGFGSHTDMSNACTDTHTVGNEMETPGNKARTVRMLQNESKTNNSPVEAASQRSDEPNGCRDQMDALSIQMDTHNIGNDTRKPVNGMEHVRMCQTDSKMQNLPYTRETATSKPTYQWKRCHTPNVFGTVDMEKVSR